MACRVSEVLQVEDEASGLVTVHRDARYPLFLVFKELLLLGFIANEDFLGVGGGDPISSTRPSSGKNGQIFAGLRIRDYFTSWNREIFPRILNSESSLQGQVG